MAKHALILPFLNQSKDFTYGVEFGFGIVAPMTFGAEQIRGYFRTENEEQIRLACYRFGYDVAELKPWRPREKRPDGTKGKRRETGWVWMVLEKRDLDEPVSAGIQEDGDG